SVSQAVDARPFRGKTVRLRGALRAEVAGGAHAAMWMRVDREGSRPAFLENMDDAPVTSPDWHTYEIRGRVVEDAEQIFFGVFLIGAGKAFIDDISLEAIEQ